jgi:hypothetical protein
MTLIVRPSYTTTFADPDVQAYIIAVEEADNAALEYRTAVAIDEFVRGCKADGIWSAIKASCILAGARTLAGALVPLAGTAPTNVSFVSGDYNRKTGLVGDGSTKYLNSNRNNNSDPQDSNHNAVYVSTIPTNAVESHVYMGVGPVTNETGANNIIYTFNASFPGPRHAFRNRNAASTAHPGATPIGGMIATNRSSGTSFVYRLSGTNTSLSSVSQAPRSANVIIFATENGNVPTNARLAFYSIGESLDLALLDARVTTLITAFGVAIP